MDANIWSNRRALKFFQLVFELSIPLWIIELFIDVKRPHLDFSTIDIGEDVGWSMINISSCRFPNYDSSYNPFVLAVLVIIATITITYLWRANALADDKFSSLQKDQL